MTSALLDRAWNGPLNVLRPRDDLDEFSPNVLVVDWNKPASDTGNLEIKSVGTEIARMLQFVGVSTQLKITSITITVRRIPS
jgi:hypothetical protein